MGDSFGNIFLIATVLVGCCFVPALFLPRKPAQQTVDQAAVLVA